MLGVVGVVALAAAALAAGAGDDGVDNASTMVAPYGEDGAVGDIAVGDAFSDVDRALGGTLNLPMTTQAPEKSQPGAMPPVAPSTGAASRSAAGGGVAMDAGSANGSSSLIDDRKIVQTASMRLEVKEVGASFEEVGRVATSVGGFVASSSFSNQGDIQVASVTIRVPSTSYQQVLSDLRGLGVKVVNEDSRSSDVTAEYTDLNARLRNLEATETQLLELLSRATTISEILQVQDRLNNTRSEIEQVKGRMALLDKLTDLATIAVHLAPVAPGAGGGDGSRLGNEIAAAWDESIEFLTDVAAGALHVVVFAWWVPVLGIPALIIGRSWLRSRPRAIEVVD
jgi:hypothetical protein